MIRNGDDVYILSAYLTESDYAYQEKLDWLKEHIPELTVDKTILLPYGENKAAYLKEHYSPIAHDDVLIDDYTQNLLKWRDYGGEGIKYLNGINHTRGTWQGVTIGENAPTLTETIQAFRSDSERMNGLLASGDMSFRYQLLDRMRSDCEYFLGNGGGHDKYLWGGDVHSHVYFMRGLWNSFPNGYKPEWITFDDINSYEQRMNTKTIDKGGITSMSRELTLEELQDLLDGRELDPLEPTPESITKATEGADRKSVRDSLESKRNSQHSMQNGKPAGEATVKKDNLDGVISSPSTDSYSR